MDIYVFFGGPTSAGACLQMIIVSELIIKLDEQPLSSAAAVAAAAAAAAHTPHIYTHAHALHGYIPEQIFDGKRKEGRRDRSTSCLLFFGRVTLFAECRRNGRSMTHLFIFIAQV